jgi:uncharacterized protein (TIGR04222 family)
MKPEHQSLWERIDSFDIDGDPAPALRFTDRLARENSWTEPFARRALREYKRFVFLTMTAGRSMCPSEQVDQVWHLHLTYTRSYWERFCRDLLKSPLHHEPTRGGPAEGQKHWAMYADTLRAYREAFGEDPPADLWPPAERRFGDDLAVAKVNRQEYWLIRKPRLARPALAATVVAAVACAIGCAGNPFDLKGTDFLPVFFAAWGVAFAVGLIVRWACRGPSLNSEDPIPELGPYDLAYLYGGRPRVLATALVRLKEQGHVDFGDDGEVRIRNVPTGGDRVERQVFDGLALQSAGVLDLKPLHQVVKDVEDARFGRLRDEGLLPTPANRVIGSTVPILLCLSAIGLFGLTRLFLGLANDRPVGYLVGSLIATFVVTMIAFARPVRRTRKAEAVLANLSKRHERLRKLSNDPQPGDASLAVAMFGVAVLSGTAYAAMYDRMRKFDAAGAGGGCGSTGCSGAGCGGGGGGGGGCGGGGGGCGGCGGGGGD